MSIIEKLEEIDKKLDELKEDKATKIAVINIEAPVANQEYHRQLPENLKGFYIQERGGSIFRFAFEPGKVGSATPSPPYYSVPINGFVLLDDLDIAELHLYVAGAVANRVAELVVWSKL